MYASEWQHIDKTRPEDAVFGRFFAEIGGKPIGLAQCFELSHFRQPGRYSFDISVLPSYRQQGIGSQLFEQIKQYLASFDPTTLASVTFENKADALQFLTNRGFTQVLREPISHLDVTSFDPATFASLQSKITANGIDIKSVARLQQEDSNWVHKLWDLEWELIQDIPGPTEQTRQPLDEFKKRLEGPWFNPEVWTVAVDGDMWIGLSVLFVVVDRPEFMSSGVTGVKRPYRRRGIATAMKVRNITFAQKHSVKTIETANEENNPMYALNQQLGFQPQPALLTFEKSLG